MWRYSLFGSTSLRLASQSFPPSPDLTAFTRLRRDRRSWERLRRFIWLWRRRIEIDGIGVLPLHQMIGLMDEVVEIDFDFEIYGFDEPKQEQCEKVDVQRNALADFLSEFRANVSDLDEGFFGGQLRLARTLRDRGKLCQHLAGQRRAVQERYFPGPKGVHSITDAGDTTAGWAVDRISAH